MRLWSLHPKYLDSKGLVALWREGLLAQKVLMGLTRGYKNHPQLNRFKNSSDPVGAIAKYLRTVQKEAQKRGYNFDKSKIAAGDFADSINVTYGQLNHEFKHLLNKLKTRDPKLHDELETIETINEHPMLNVVEGEPENWEILR